MKTVGAVVFIHLLLLIAGVEPNPGPSDVLVFRYMYLLIEVGTHLLRKLFNNKVSNDFMQYLKTNNKAAKQLQFLLGSDVITDHQKQFLPPLDNSPNTENFDITLLVCFLRNICGLKQYKDPVWKCPASRDGTVEAEITRLKECRNFVVHTGTVYISESDFKQKWSELSQILQRLNYYCGVTNLTEMIEDANNKPLDDQLKQQHDNILKVWHKAESLFEKGIDQIKIGQSKIKQTQSELKAGQSEIKQTQSELKAGQSEIKQTQSELKDGQSDIKQTQSELKAGQSEIKQTQSELKDGQSKLRLSLKNVHKKQKDHTKLLKSVQDLQQQTKRRLDNSEQSCNTTKRVKSLTNDDIQKKLIDAYQDDICSSLPLCPLLEGETEDTLKMYQKPTMYVVNYHEVEKQQTDKSSDSLEKVKTCSDLFHVKDKDCKNIYLTGDAGVGKTSFCKFLSLLWCKSKSTENTAVSNTSFCIFFSLLCCKSKVGKKLEKVDMQEYIDYLDRFEFVFYVNLRDTHYTDLVAIIVNQLFYSENKDSSNRMYDIVEDILGNHDSLVIMDGLDEWTPKPTDKRMYEIPVRPKSLKCVYFTTCRPYKIENVRLSETNLDHQVKMTGLGYTEKHVYVSNLIKIINSKYDENKNKYEFMKAVEQVNLEYMLHIPMITSHLVMLWFDRPLTSMSKSLIYGNIMDLLFKLAHKKEIDIQQSTPSKLKLPDRLSELKHFKDHFSQIEQLCLLSFKLLFEHDTDITSLVFTRDLLASEPYCLSEEETNLFCTIGILSKNKVKRKFGKQEHKLSFLHKSYLEFFAAIYVSTLDTSDVLELFNQCRTINDVLKYKNFLIFYAGLSIDNLVLLMTRIYTLISKDLDLARVKLMFSTPSDRRDEQWSLLYLQNLILKCNIDGSCQVENSLPLEDLIYDEYDEEIPETEFKYLRKLISNINNGRLLSSETGECFDEFDHISSLKGLCIYSFEEYEREFNKLIKQNKSSLQIISVAGRFDAQPTLPLDDLHYLTSLSLVCIVIPHECMQYLTKFLSNNSLLKHLRLGGVRCTEHRWGSDVCASFKLVQCKLVFLSLGGTTILCTNINTSSLEYFTFQPDPYTEGIARCDINVFNSIQYALELKHLYINGEYRLDDHMVETLITNVQYLSKIETITLRNITIRDNVSFLLHPSVKQVSILLDSVNMTARLFKTFIESVIYKHCRIKFSMWDCIIRQDNGDTKGGMSYKESFDYILDYIKSISAIKKVDFCRYNSLHIIFVINDNQ